MRLHEDQSTTGRGLRQFVDNPRGAVFLLRRRVDQHVAVRQDVTQPIEVGAGPVGVARVGVGTIDENHVFEQIAVGALEIKLIVRQTEGVKLDVGVSDQDRPTRRRTLPARRRDFCSHECIDERTLAGARAAEHRHDERRFQSNPQRPHTIEHPSEQRRRPTQRPPRRVDLGERRHRFRQVVDLGQHLQP